MNIYISHSTGFDYKNELYKPFRESQLHTKHTLTFPHLKSKSQFNTKEYLKTCNLVIAEVSHPSTGQGIELGWAHAHGVPIVCIHKKGTKTSDSLKAVSYRIIKYTNGEDMVEKITDYLLTM